MSNIYNKTNYNKLLKGYKDLQKKNNKYVNIIDELNDEVNDYKELLNDCVVKIKNLENQIKLKTEYFVDNRGQIKKK